MLRPTFGEWSTLRGYNSIRGAGSKKKKKLEQALVLAKNTLLSRSTFLEVSDRFSVQIENVLLMM